MVKYALFFPYLVGLSFVTMSSTQKPTNQIPRCKQRGIKLATLQSSGVFDPRGIRQLAVQARPLGSLLAGIKAVRAFRESGTFPMLQWAQKSWPTWKSWRPSSTSSPATCPWRRLRSAVLRIIMLTIP